MTLDTAAPFHARADRRSPAGPWLVFALLVVSWLCANRPQPLVYAVTDWVKGAAKFSHQQRLADDVRALLAAQAGPAPAQAQLAATSGAPEQTTPPVPENCVHQRPEWSLGETLSVPLPDFVATNYSSPRPRMPSSPSADVPHPPPRSIDLG